MDDNSQGKSDTVKTFEALEEKYPKLKQQSNAKKALAYLNAKYCVVQDGSRVRVHSFEHHEHRGHVRQVSTFLHFQEFGHLLMNIPIKIKDKWTDIGSFWLKGRDGISVPNMLHVMIASNDDWVVPAGERERRYVMFDVPDIHIQEAKWFDPINAELEGGGYSAMLFDLLKHDLGDWHPRKIPANCGLLDQQARSLSATDAWWLELLESGRLWGCEPSHPERAVSSAYDADVSSTFHSRIVRQPGLFDQARALVPQLKHHTTDHELGRHLRAQGCSNDKKVMRRQGWTFPPLAECRAKWEVRFPGWKWRNMALLAWSAEEADDAPEAETTVIGPENRLVRSIRKPVF